MIGNKKALPNLYSLPQPPRKGRRSLPQPLRREGSASSQVFCRKLSDKEPSPYPSCAHRHSPPFGGVGGGFCISLCKTDNYKGICRTCYSSTPKNDCFLNKVAYLCKQKTEAPPDLPEGGGGKFASILQKLSEKESKVLILFCAHRHSSPFGEAGWGFSSSPRGEECRSRDCPKKFQKLVLVCLEISVLSVKD